MHSLLDPIPHYYHTAHSTSLHLGLIWLPYLAKGRPAPPLLKIWSPARTGTTYAHTGLKVTGALSCGQRSCFCSTNRAAPCASFALLWWPPPVATPRISLHTTTRQAWRMETHIGKSLRKLWPRGKLRKRVVRGNQRWTHLHSRL